MSAYTLQMKFITPCSPPPPRQKETNMNNLYRKLPVVVETKRLLDNTMWEVNAWIDKEGGKTGEWSWDEDEKYITIETLEGNHKATVGDWIIKGVHGEFYPCKPEIFAKTYEHASAPTPPVAVARPTDDQLWDQTLSERDHYHEVADKLANAIAAHFSIEIGEHSSANCPWDNALNAIEERTYSDVEALRKDAERYRWLRDHSRVFKHRRFQPERYGNLDIS